MQSRRKFPLWNIFFSLVHVSHSYWHPIIATSFSKDNSSEFLPIIHAEFGEQQTRDQRHRISPDPSDSQLHVGAAYLQFTPLIFYRVQVRELRRPWQKLHLVLIDNFFFFLMFVLDYCPDGSFVFIQCFCSVLFCFEWCKNIHNLKWVTGCEYSLCFWCAHTIRHQILLNVWQIELSGRRCMLELEDAVWFFYALSIQNKASEKRKTD